MELAHQITLDAQLRSWYDGLVWPQLQAAENNEYILRAAIEAYFTWLAHLQALSAAFCRPLEAEYHLEINQALASMDRGLQNALAKAHETCVADRDPYQITHMFAWAAYSLAISQVRDLTQEATSRVDRCLRFELDFESRIWDAEGLSGHVRAQGVPLQTVAPYAVEQYEGEGPLTYVEFVFPYEDCPVSVQTSDAFLEVLLLSIALGEHPPPGGVVAHINPGYTMEVVTFHCEDGSYALPPTTWWRAGFSVAHMDSLDYGMGGYRVDNWGVLYPGGVFANKVYGPRHVGEGVMEHTTLTLRHTPLP